MAKCSVDHRRQFLGLIILHFCINVHSDFAVFVTGQVLHRLRVHLGIDEICNIGVPQHVGRDLEIQTVDHFAVVGRRLSENRRDRAFELLTVDVTGIAALLGGSCHDILPDALELGVGERAALAVCYDIGRIGPGLGLPQTLRKTFWGGYPAAPLLF